MVLLEHKLISSWPGAITERSIGGMNNTVNRQINASLLGHLFGAFLCTIYYEEFLAVNPAPTMELYYFVLHN
jgi:hypothetical protein